MPVGHSRGRRSLDGITRLGNLAGGDCADDVGLRYDAHQNPVFFDEEPAHLRVEHVPSRLLHFGGGFDR